MSGVSLLLTRSDDVVAIYETYRLRSGSEQTDLAEAYEEHFGEPLDVIADTPRMIIVASRLDDSTERMIAFLQEQFRVPVNAALFQPFAGGLIGRTWLRPDHGARPSTRSSSNSESRDQAKTFWDLWLPIGREAVPEIRLPAHGPRSVLIKRRIIPGIPAALTVWVSSSEAYAEVQFDDDEPSMNEALLSALSAKRIEIERAFGGPLEWRRLDGSGLMTRRTKVVTPKVSIGEKVRPTEQGLTGLADLARRLLLAVKPHLSEAVDQALEATAEAEANAEPEDLPVIGGL